jgi:superfamily I DNA/RNA helicase
MGLTAEQAVAAGLKRGKHLLVANAGTGKTFTLKELWIRCYERELQRWSKRGALDNRSITRLCRQFITTTFTVKAAAELNERLHGLFQERGLETPENYGRPYRFCRTLDSYLTGWVGHPRFFTVWSQADTELQKRLRGLKEVLPAGIVARWTDGEKDPDFSIFKKWRWSIPNEMGEFLIELIVRELLNWPVSGFDLKEWEMAFHELLRTYHGDPSEVHERFWLSRIQAKRKYVEQMRHLEREVEHGLIEDKERLGAAMRLTKEWRAVQGMAREFSTVFGLARVRNFDPIHNPEAMASNYLLRQLAQSQSIETLEGFLFIATRYTEIKQSFFARDFTDNLVDFTHTVNAHPELLEKDREFPLWIRGKYIFWDEVQDNNGFQFEVLNLFTPHPSTPFLSVSVGDPKQAIYAWRGAAPKRFSRAIEKMLEAAPNCVHTLTISFRSAKKVVALGNEIVQTLPSYAKSVFPSSTVISEEGEVIVSRIIYGPEDEAAWVMTQIDRLMMSAPDESIMIIARTDPIDHPIAQRIKEFYPQKEVQYMTIHRSKGLEADNVIILGLTAGKFPDMRSDDADSEINLFYVAATRPRKRLFLAIPTMYERMTNEGVTECVTSGPSPFLWQVPTLRRLCLQAGWPKKTLQDSERIQMGTAASVGKKAKEKFGTLREDAHRIFGAEALDDPDSDSTIFDHGSAELAGRIENGNIESISLGAEELCPVDDWKNLSERDRKFRTRVFGKLQKAFLRSSENRLTGRALSTGEFRFACGVGWISRHHIEKSTWVFTPQLIEIVGSYLKRTQGADLKQLMSGDKAMADPIE